MHNCRCLEYGEIIFNSDYAVISRLVMRLEGKKVPEHCYSLIKICYCVLCTQCSVHSKRETI